MKTRLTFVSNSSSSSFVCLVQKVGKISEEYKDLILDPKERYIVEGKWLSEGIDVIKLNTAMQKYLIKNKDNDAYEEVIGNDIYRVVATGEFSAEISVDTLLNKIDKKNKIIVIAFDADYYSSHDLNSLKENYE